MTDTNAALSPDPADLSLDDLRALRQQLRLQPHPVRRSKGKPDKKERRQLQQIRYVGGGE